MATAHGADFATQSFRHGVLIGNWNEEQYGCDLLNLTQSAAAASQSQPQQSRHAYPLTTTHSTFTSAGHDIIRSSVFQEKNQQRATPEVEKSLLFAHRGSEPIERRYQTSYNNSYSGASMAGGAAPMPVEKSVHKFSQQRSESDEDGGRYRTYRTSSSDAFNAQNSILALRADEGSQQMKKSAARTGELAQSLEANYRKLRLRKD